MTQLEYRPIGSCGLSTEREVRKLLPEALSKYSGAAWAEVHPLLTGGFTLGGAIESLIVREGELSIRLSRLHRWSSSTFPTFQPHAFDCMTVTLPINESSRINFSGKDCSVLTIRTDITPELSLYVRLGKVPHNLKDIIL